MVSGTGLEKDAEKVRNETLQNLENCVPVYTGAQFSFSACHLQIVDFEYICWLHLESPCHPFLRFPVFSFRCFFWTGFMSEYCYSTDTRERFGEPRGEFLRGETPPGEGFEGTFS